MKTCHAEAGLPFGSTSAVALNVLSATRNFFFSSASFAFSLGTLFFGLAFAAAGFLVFFLATGFFFFLVTVRFFEVTVVFRAAGFRVRVAVLVVAKARTDDELKAFGTDDDGDPGKTDCGWRESWDNVRVT
jgi:hypothetical protein